MTATLNQLTLKFNPFSAANRLARGLAYTLSPAPGAGIELLVVTGGGGGAGAAGLAAGIGVGVGAAAGLAGALAPSSL